LVELEQQGCPTEERIPNIKTPIRFVVSVGRLSEERSPLIDLEWLLKASVRSRRGDCRLDPVRSDLEKRVANVRDVELCVLVGQLLRIEKA